MGTYNVRSLYRGPDGHQGKLNYARRAQFKEHRLNFLGLQEARTDAGSFLTDEVFRLATGHVNGTLGLELWVNLSQPYGFLGKKPLLFCRRHFTVVHAGPRLLLTHVTAPGFDSWICVAHAPHCGAPEIVRHSWWESLSTTLAQFCQREDLFLLIDANATTGSPDALCVLDFSETENANTENFRTLLSTFSLCLPSTAHCHSGPRATWTTPSGLHSQCIDYVGIPQHLFGACTMSGSLETLDLDSDHIGAAVQLAWQSWTSPQRTPTSSRGSYAREGIVHDEALHQELQTGPLPPWSCDIEHHVDSLNHTMLQGLRRHFPSRPSTAKKIYMDPALWELRVEKQRTRKTLKILRCQSSRLHLQACFGAWKNSFGPPQADDPVDVGIAHHNYFSTIYCCSVRQFTKLHQLTRQLRTLLRTSKLDQLNQALTSLDPGLPFIGPTNPKKRKCRGLPHILQPDGQPCRDSEDIMNCWIHFFQTMEGGQRMKLDDLRASWRHSLDHARIEEQTIPLNEVPTLLDLETAFRRVQKGKAIGDDLIPGELCHTHPAAVARLAYGPLLKLVCQGQESLLHKGGTLVPVWKQKGAQNLVQSYRSILVSSHFGKGIHRAIRQHQQTLYTEFLHAGQLGGRPHVPVGLGLHAAQAHLRLCQQRSRSCSLLFLDLTEAFYRVIRELIIEGPITDEQIAQVAARIGLPPLSCRTSMRSYRPPQPWIEPTSHHTCKGPFVCCMTTPISG